MQVTIGSTNEIGERECNWYKSYNLPYLNTQWRKSRKGSEGEDKT